MKLSLRGLHKVRRRLADGRVATYFYAWRGKDAPRLLAEPGTPAFIAEWQAALATRADDRPRHHDGTLQGAWIDWQRSAEWANLAASTQAEYARKLAMAEPEFGDLPLRAVTDRRFKGDLMAWRDRLALDQPAKGKAPARKGTPRTADYALQVLSAGFSWMADRGLIAENPILGFTRLHDATRVDSLWHQAEVDAFLKAAPAQLHLPFLLALWTGQRQGDVLRLTWTRYDGRVIRLTQGKGGRRMEIPVAAELKRALDAAPRRALTICTTSRGSPWTGDGFRSSWATALEKAGIEDLTYHDLRGTAVTRLALAGCTVPEIATITGHSLKQVAVILDRHYLTRDPALAESAIAKLERHQKKVRAKATKGNEP